jgi:hypothetical protein
LLDARRRHLRCNLDFLLATHDLSSHTMAKAKAKKPKTADQLQRFKDMARELAVPESATLDGAFGKVAAKKSKRP